MAMSEKMKAMGDEQRQIFVSRVKKLYECGMTAEDISKSAGKDLDLAREAIEMIELANG